MQFVRWVRGLCARESLSRRSPGGLSQDFFGLRIEREALVLRPCLGCFLSYKERTEVDKSLYLVKNNCCSQPDLIWGASRSLDTHFFSSGALDSFSDPYFVTLCHVRHPALIHVSPLSSTDSISLPLTSISLQAVPSPSSHILPLRGGSCSEVGAPYPRWGEVSLPRLEGKDPSVSLPKTSS